MAIVRKKDLSKTQTAYHYCGIYYVFIPNNDRCQEKDQVSLFRVNAHIWRAWRCAEYPPYYNKR